MRKQQPHAFEGQYSLCGITRLNFEASSCRTSLLNNRSGALILEVEACRQEALKQVTVLREDETLYLKACVPEGMNDSRLALALYLPRHLLFQAKLAGNASLTSRLPMEKMEMTVTEGAKATFHMAGCLTLRTYHRGRVQVVCHAPSRVEASATDQARVVLTGAFNTLLLYASGKGGVESRGPISKRFEACARGHGSITHEGARPDEGATKIHTEGKSARVRLVSSDDTGPHPC